MLAVGFCAFQKANEAFIQGQHKGKVTLKNLIQIIVKQFLKIF